MQSSIDEKLPHIEASSGHILMHLGLFMKFIHVESLHPMHEKSLIVYTFIVP